jgi:hypothetical protein
MNSGTPDDAVTGQAPENESEQRPKAYSELPPEKRINDILEEAADLPERQVFRKRQEIAQRLYCVTGQEWDTYEVVKEVRRRRQERQGVPQPNPGQSATAPSKLTRIGPIIRDEYCKEGAGLLPHHHQLITASAIKPEVARERGYRTIFTKAELRNYGFGQSQQITPTLLLPLYDAKSKLAGYQHRPDYPRLVGDPPKSIKYETPSKWRMRIDVPPLLTRKSEIQNEEPYFDTTEVPAPISNPTIPLLITEGVRKADSAVSIALCCIALLGVWNWRGANDAGGKTALTDWDDIALNDRVVYITFDSDVMTNGHVHAALVRLRDFLTRREAIVRQCPGEHRNRTLRCAAGARRDWPGRTKGGSSSSLFVGQRPGCWPYAARHFQPSGGNVAHALSQFGGNSTGDQD